MAAVRNGGPIPGILASDAEGAAARCVIRNDFERRVLESLIVVISV